MMSTTGDFYRGRRVLVTGHTGFKGGWLVSWLKALGADVIGLSLPPEEEDTRFFVDARIGEDMVSLHGDVRDAGAMVRCMREYRPEIVFHLAAQSLVRRSYRDPVGTYATNVMGTVNVLEAIRQTSSVRSAVMVTTDKCYENREWMWGYRETDAMGGHDPYSSSKGCAELAISAYARSYFDAASGPVIVSARAGNVVGGGDWSEDRLVPDIIRALVAGEPVHIRNPRAWRPWQHVLEPLSGYLLLAQQAADRDDLTGAWNFGPPHEQMVTVLVMAQRIIEAWGDGSITLMEDPAAPHEAHALTVDSTKARVMLGWRPVLSHQQTVDLTVEWYRNQNADPAAAAALTWTQIERYGALLAAPAPFSPPLSVASGSAG